MADSIRAQSAHGSTHPILRNQASAVETTDSITIDMEPADRVGASSNASPNAQSKTVQSNAGQVSFMRILGHATSLERMSMVLAGICAAIAGAILPVMIIFFGRLVSQFNDYFIPGNDISQADFERVFSNNSLYIVYLFIGKSVLGYFSLLAFRMTGIRISATIRRRYIGALFKQPISAMDKLPPGYATDSLGRAANAIQLGVSDKISLLIQAAALTIAGYAVAFTYSWQLTLAMSSSVVFILVAYGVFMAFWVKFETKINEANGKASGVAGNVLRGIRTIKSLCAEEAVLEQYRAWIDQAKAVGFQMTPLAAMQISLAFFPLYSSLALALWLGTKLYVEGTVSGLQDIVIAFSNVLLVLGALGNVVHPLQLISQATAASAALFKVIDSPQRPIEGLKAPDVTANQDIQFRNVRFAYPSRPNTEILKGLDLYIPKGKNTALVGPSGCGKSTIVALMERWYQLTDINELPAEPKDESAPPGEPQNVNIVTTDVPPVEMLDTLYQNAGEVNFGDHNIEQLDLKWWRSQIGLVQQEPVLFNTTIFENVAMGLAGSEWETASESTRRKLVEEACQESFAHEFITRLPQKYETQVGDGGIKLSGGQRQRLAIARAIVKQPTIFILDEATSSVDGRAERIVQAALEKASRNRTTITIAHRLSTIKMADHIVVLQAGKAAERGTHDELAAIPNGIYHTMINAQKIELGIEEQEKNENQMESAEFDSVVAARPLQTSNGKTPMSTVKAETPVQSSPDEAAPAQSPNKRGFFRSAGRLVWEQNSLHPWLFGFIVLSAACGGAVFAIQSYTLSHYMAIFTEPDRPDLLSRGSFWALMLFVSALSALVSFGAISGSLNVVSVQATSRFTLEYFENICGMVEVLRSCQSLENTNSEQARKLAGSTMKTGVAGV